MRATPLGMVLFTRPPLVVVVGGTSSAAVWDTTFNASLSYTNTNHTATKTSGAGSVSSARVTTAQTAAYGEIKVGSLGTGGSYSVGIGDSAFLPNSGWFGSDLNAVGYEPDGNVYRSGSSLGVFSTYGLNDIIGMCIKAGKIYLSNNGTWLTGMDPSAGTGGIDVSATFTSGYLMTGGDATSSVFILQSTLNYPVPTGTSAW